MLHWSKPKFGATMVYPCAPASPALARFLICLAWGLVGCGVVEVDFGPSHSVTLAAGTRFDITLGTQYSSPPTISSPAVRFLHVQLVTPAVPAGPRQLFRFATVSPGEAIITFHRTGGGQTVEDTVRVQ